MDHLCKAICCVATRNRFVYIYIYIGTRRNFKSTKSRYCAKRFQVERSNDSSSGISSKVLLSLQPYNLFARVMLVRLSRHRPCLALVLFTRVDCSPHRVRLRFSGSSSDARLTGYLSTQLPRFRRGERSFPLEEASGGEATTRREVYANKSRQIALSKILVKRRVAAPLSLRVRRRGDERIEMDESSKSVSRRKQKIPNPAVAIVRLVSLGLLIVQLPDWATSTSQGQLATPMHKVQFTQKGYIQVRNDERIGRLIN